MKGVELRRVMEDEHQTISAEGEVRALDEVVGVVCVSGQYTFAIRLVVETVLYCCYLPWICVLCVSPLSLFPLLLVLVPPSRFIQSGLSARREPETLHQYQRTRLRVLFYVMLTCHQHLTTPISPCLIFFVTCLWLVNQSSQSKDLPEFTCRTKVLYSPLSEAANSHSFSHFPCSGHNLLDPFIPPEILGSAVGVFGDL